MTDFRFTSLPGGGGRADELSIPAHENRTVEHTVVGRMSSKPGASRTLCDACAVERASFDRAYLRSFTSH